jgi:DNA-binding NarL/FixJ family response regulator
MTSSTDMTSQKRRGVSTSIRVAIVEDEPLFRDLLRRSMNGLTLDDPASGNSSVVDVVCAVGSAHEAMELDASTFDVLVTDLHLGHGETTGFDAALRAKEHNPEIGVVILSNMVLPSIFNDVPKELAAGWAYLLKTSVSAVRELAHAVRVARSGGMLIDVALMRNLSTQQSSPLTELSPRQREVLNGITAGWSNRHIADQLGMSVRTVEAEVSSIFTSLGISTTDGAVNARVACVLKALQHLSYSPGALLSSDR